MSTYYCNHCERDEESPICAICGGQTENLDVVDTSQNDEDAGSDDIPLAELEDDGGSDWEDDD